jgi:phosphoglycerol transferase
MAKKRRNKSGNPAAGSVQTLPGIQPAASVALSTYSVAGSGKGSTGFYNTSWFEWLSIAVVSVLSFWFLTARIVGVQVSVLADEYLYLLDSHYNGLSEAKYPNYLFQWIYSSTKMCGAEFYSCARSINAFFVIFGAVFIYLLAKHIGRSKLLAGLAAVAAILGSYGTYTAYFMPEAIFNGLMMVFFWAIIRFGKTDDLLAWAAIGSSLGIASLAKPHGLFVVPAVVIFIALWTRATKDKWLIPALLRNFVFVASVVGAKFLFGYLLAGERALSLFGMYGTLESVAQTATTTITSSSEGGTSVFFTAWGQVLMVTMILGLSLPVAIHGLILSLKRDAVVAEQVRLRSLMGLLLLSLMPAIAIFESWQNLGVWMHTRYYTYLIPLAVVALLETLRPQDQKLWPWAKYTVAGVFIGLAGVNLVTAAAPFSSNWIDAPDFTVHIGNLALSSLAIVITIIAALIWPWLNKSAIGIALVVSCSMSMFSGQSIANFLKTNFGQEMGYENIARVLSEFIPQNETDRTVIYGQNEVLQRTVFSARSGSIEIRPESQSGLNIAEIDPAKAWLVTVGDAVLKGIGNPTIVGLGFNMYSLDSKNSLAPREKTISSFSSACSSEGDAQWACGSETSIVLSSGFSNKATVHLIFELSEAASQNEIEFALGDASIRGKFGPGISSVFIKFTNPSPTDKLTIRSLPDQSGAPGSQEKFMRPMWGYSSETK